MHATQQKILKLAKSFNLAEIGPRQIGRLIGESHPQKIVHHIKQLEKKGLIYKDATGKIAVAKTGLSASASSLFRLPVVGSADCGPATLLAEQNIESILRISSAMIERKSPDGLFVVIASGNSLNRAEAVKGGTIEDGDYVIVDGKNRNPVNGQYVLSIIDGAANLKRFYRDEANQQIILASESTENLPPIYIHFSDFNNYFVNGTIIRVIKKPR